jgi:hypothetical protein
MEKGTKGEIDRWMDAWMKGERKEGRERWMDGWGTKFYNKLKQGSISMPKFNKY